MRRKASRTSNLLAALDRFQAALRGELSYRRCPLPGPLQNCIIFPRAFRGRATLVHWRQGDSSATEWAVAIHKSHGWCIEIPAGAYLLDLDKEGTLELLTSKLPRGYGLVESSPCRYHVWLCGEAPPGQHVGRLDGLSLEVHGPGRLATLPPSRHVDTGRSYRWLRPFLATSPTTPHALGIVLVGASTKALNHRSHFTAPAGATPLHELMSQFTGQDGHLQGQEYAFFCPRHDDKHRSLMVNDIKGVFYCHGAGCGFKGNKVTLDKLLGIRHRRVIEVPL